MSRTATAGLPEAEARVLAATLRFWPELVTALGGAPEALLAACGIDAAVFADGEATVPYHAKVELLARSAEVLGCPDFGRRLAQRQAGMAVIGPVGVVMEKSETLGQALGYCARHIHAYSLGTRVRFRPDRERQRLLVRLELLLDRAADARQAVEHGLLLAHLNAQAITGGRAGAREVSLRHAALAPPATYRAAFGCPVRFGAEVDGIVFSERDLLCPVLGADEARCRQAASLVEARYPPAAPKLGVQVRALVNQRLGSADCTAERIAADLALHPRTLQRRLRGEGGSFEAIKDAVRREVALRCLAQADMPLTQVAERLGYAEASVLTRSCNRWFAATPSAVRRAAGARAA